MVARRIYSGPRDCVTNVLLTGTEHLAAAIATRGKLRVVAIAAVDLLGLGAELFVHERDAAFVAQETGLMPMLLLVRQILQLELRKC